MTRILGHIGKISNYRILHRIFWWRMSLPPFWLLSVVNVEVDETPSAAAGGGRMAGITPPHVIRIAGRR